MIRSNEETLKDTDKSILSAMSDNLKNGILARWYPLVLDHEMGGYFSNVSYEWEILPEQEKMIVSQARHIWTASKISRFLGDTAYTEYARFGLPFMKEKMWDGQYGGFFQIRDRDGGLSYHNNWLEEKRTYGNAFAIYALASLYDLTKDESVLEFAKEAFQWLEEHAYDPVNKGYFQFFTRDGHHFDKNSGYKCTAGDANEVGYKDQNSSIHLLEAYTELYNVWKDEKLKQRLESILKLIRDTMTTDKGYLQLFFNEDWTPVSFRNAADEERRANYGLDHVSFGHDYETAFLMLEASHALGLKDDTTTLTVAKKMMDHALENGFDSELGGFYDGGYYFDVDGKCQIIKDTKNWWAQAEALNSLLMFSKIFPEEEKYFSAFLKQWDYVNKYIIDHENGDWFEGGLDKEPHFKSGPRSHIWKCTYHTGRALMNCIKMLSDETYELIGNEGFSRVKKESDEFLEHWRKVAAKMG